MIPHRGGLPHSDIHGSKPARGSPWLFAACHVLHRLLVPRHPPNALIALDTKATALQKRPPGSHHAQEPSHPLSRADPEPAAQQASFYSAHYPTPLNTDAIHRGTILSVLARYDPFRSDSHSRQHRPTRSSPLRKPSRRPTRPETHQNQIYNTKEQTKHGARHSGTDPTTLSHETALGLCPKPHQRTVVLWKPD